jgi:signal transduction histidine kinase
MSERAKEFGGQLLVERAHPGTIVEVTIPVSAAASSPCPRPQEKTTVLESRNDPFVGRVSAG